jgi:hypothetical protein
VLHQMLLEMSNGNYDKVLAPRPTLEIQRLEGMLFRRRHVKNLQSNESIDVKCEIGGKPNVTCNV